MHGSAQGIPIEVSTFGGLVTLANPESLPEGASPRCQDNDYLVGSTQTRAGLTSVYTYAGGSVGPIPGGAAVDTPLNGGQAWSNPANVLLNTGVYASVNLPVLFISAVQIVDLKLDFVNFNSAKRNTSAPGFSVSR